LSRVFPILSVLLFLAGSSVFCAAQQNEQPGPSQMLLILPFENHSTAPGLDWISEAFPEVLSNRFSRSPLFVLSREDRLSAFDHLGIPASARPSRATVYQVAQAMDADYVLIGNFTYDGKELTAHAHLMNMARLRLGPELSESGPLTDLIRIQTALAWDVLEQLKLAPASSQAQFVAQFPPIRLDALEDYVLGVTASSDQEKIKYLKQAASLDPQDASTMLQLGETYYRLRDYSSAITWLTKIPNSDTASNEADFYLGLSQFYAGQMQKAEAAFSELASRLPLTEIYNNLGVAAARLGDRQARTYFERTVKVDPSDPDYHFNLAVELSREGDKEPAIRELRATLALGADPEARNLLDALVAGTQSAHLPLERIKRNYDESSFRQLALEIENAGEARLQQAPPAQHAAFHVQRGEEFLQQGIAGEAEKQFREAVLLDPQNAAAHAGLARALESEQDKAEARTEARAALLLKPTPEAYLVLARLDLAENNQASAEQNLEHALALDPENAAAASLKHDLAARQPKASH
jgi:Flp pilus assembly protein TadD/TolB-like protein